MERSRHNAYNLFQRSMIGLPTAQQAERIELRADLTWLQSRHLIRELVGARYILPE